MNAATQEHRAVPSARPALRVLLWLVPLVIYAGAAVYFASKSPYSLYDFPLDDSWIHRVYAKSFAFGRGFEYNYGSQEAGSTSPLWVIVSSPAHWLEPLGVRVVTVAVKAIGVVLGGIAVWLVLRIAALTTRSSAVGVAAASLFALEPRLLFSALSGMEVNLLVALWLGAIYAFLAGRGTLSFVLLGLAAVTRPEAALILPLCPLVSVLCWKRSPSLRRPVMFVIPWVPLVLWGLFCRYANGHWLPNTYYVKGQSFVLDLGKLRLAWQALTEHGYASLFVFLPGVAVYLISFCRRDRRDRIPELLFLVAAPVLYLLGIFGTREIRLQGYYWTRWADPVSLLLTVSFCVGYASVLTGGGSLRGIGLPDRRWARLALVALGVAGLVFCGRSFLTSFRERRDRLASDSRAIHLINVRSGEWINEHVPLHATVGVNDAGAIRYFGSRRTIDLMGLNNADVAFRRIKPDELVGELDWIAVFPDWFRDSNLLTFFEQRQAFWVPLEEYTVTRKPYPTVKVICEKKLPRPEGP